MVGFDVDLKGWNFNNNSIDLTPDMTPEETKADEGNESYILQPDPHQGGGRLFEKSVKRLVDMNTGLLHFSACEETSYRVELLSSTGQWITVPNGLFRDMSEAFSAVDALFNSDLRARAIDISTGQVLLDMQP